MKFCAQEPRLPEAFPGERAVEPGDGVLGQGLHGVIDPIGSDDRRAQPPEILAGCQLGGAQGEPGDADVGGPGGETAVADTRRPLLPFETGLPMRYYIPLEDVQMDLLEPSDRVTKCACRGQASHWHVKIGDQIYKHIAWTYHQPTTLAAPIAGMTSTTVAVMRVVDVV
jgi:uncharacterized protein (DUF427 family)